MGHRFRTGTPEFPRKLSALALNSPLRMPFFTTAYVNASAVREIRTFSADAVTISRLNEVIILFDPVADYEFENISVAH